jgi:ABC-2 type transport system ATP-binding protein
MVAQPAVQVRQLRRCYHGQPREAVAGIDFDVAPGEVFGLLGPNGAGKTTTVRICTTLLRPTSGSVAIGGEDVVQNPQGARRLLGSVSQQNSLDQKLTVRQGIHFHCRYFGLSRAAARNRTDEALERLGLQSAADRLPIALSGGLAQRAMIARAVSHRPRVLFVDEPTTGLDPEIRLVVWSLLETLRSTGVAIVLTTHNLEEADRLCDRVAIMDAGQIIACDVPAKLKRLATTEQVVDLEVADADSALFDALLNVIGVLHVTTHAPGVIRVRAGRDANCLRALFAVAEPYGLSDFTVVKPSLETVFLQLLADHDPSAAGVNT